MTSVLIVDPDQALLEMIAHHLEIRRHDCHAVRDGEAAAALIAERGASLANLITGVRLDGDISGWTVARLARQANPHIRIAYLSAEGQRNWAVQGVPDSLVIATPSTGAEIARIAESVFSARQGAEKTPPPASPPADRGRITAAVQREREILQAHFEQSPSFIAFLEGEDHCYVFANDAYLKLVERDVVGRIVVEAFPEAIGQGFVEILDRVRHTGEEFVGRGVEFEIQLDANTVKKTYIDLTYRPVRGADGDIMGIFVEGVDLTERYLSQQRIDALQHDLIHVARVNAMGQLAATIAHELNQPLTSIHNFTSAAHLLGARQALDPVIMKCLEDARTSALRAGDIIRKLRMMTRKAPVRMEPIALEAAIREAASTASTGRSDAKISYDIRSIAQVKADRVQLQQVVLNLVRNAIEAAGEENPDIRISTYDHGHFVRVSISDRGAGITEDVLPYLFTTFSTSKSEGMGIGLSLCKTIVEAHGGEISARNNAGKGATFSFTLPASKP